MLAVTGAVSPSAYFKVDSCTGSFSLLLRYLFLFGSTPARADAVDLPIPLSSPITRAAFPAKSMPPPLRS
jgi:hypothetical protein